VLSAFWSSCATATVVDRKAAVRERSPPCSTSQVTWLLREWPLGESNGSIRIAVGIVLIVLGLLLVVATLGGSLLLVLAGAVVLVWGLRARQGAGPISSTQTWIATQHATLEQQRQTPRAAASLFYPPLPPPADPAAHAQPSFVVHVASPAPTPVYMRCSHCQAIGNMLAGRCQSCGAPY
jgi:hypothetical protein